MKLNDEITLYREDAVADGAGGYTGEVTQVKIADMYAKVKPMTGNIALNYQQITGQQGYEVTIRTDFHLEAKRKYIIDFYDVYETVRLIVNSREIGVNYTKLICQSGTED